MISPSRILFSPALTSYQDHLNILCWDMKSPFGAEEQKVIFITCCPKSLSHFFSIILKIKNKTYISLGLYQNGGIHIPWLINDYAILFHSMECFSMYILPCGFIFPISMCIS